MRQVEARAHRAAAESRTVVDPSQYVEVSRLIIACRDGILPFEQAIVEAHDRIANEDIRLSSTKKRQRSAMWIFR